MCYTSRSNSFPQRQADVCRLYAGGFDQAISSHSEGRNAFTIKGILRHESRLGIETKIEVKAYQSHRSSFFPTMLLSSPTGLNKWSHLFNSQIYSKTITVNDEQREEEVGDFDETNASFSSSFAIAISSRTVSLSFARYLSVFPTRLDLQTGSLAIRALETIAPPNPSVPALL